MRYLFVTSLFILFIFGCNKKENEEKFNIFPLEKDIQLGAQFAQYIEDSTDFVILDSVQYAAAYSHLYRIRNTILNSGQVYYKDDFKWQLRIIHDDSTLNAFCAPGGYIYVYTGIIKYLDNEYSLAGVLGHEMAHADKRHSTHQMTQQYGISLLFAAVGGDKSALASVAAKLISLKYSRDDETQSDLTSVKYLCPTTYGADGAAQFFIKIGSQGVPEFLSTHPSPDNRVQNIQQEAIDLGCSGNLTEEYPGSYQALINSLP